MKRILLPVLFFVTCFVNAQSNLWQKTQLDKEEVKKEFAHYDLTQAYVLNLETLSEKLMNTPARDLSNPNFGEGTIVDFPNAKGEFKSFRVLEVSNFSEALSHKFPSIKSYRGYALENPSDIISISMNAQKIKAILFEEDHISLIEPAMEGSNKYFAYNKTNIAIHEDFKCLTAYEGIEDKPVQTQQSDDQMFRTFRLAVATDGEFGNYYGSVANALTGINDLLAIINPIYERDLAIKLELVANNDQIVFLNSSTDPFNYASQSNNNLNSATQSTITSIIGEANYDIGILFSSQADGGHAGCLACVCTDHSKGSAYAGASGFPEGYSYAMIISHEMGHQFGANHTFSRAEGFGANREPGSGTTIMSYAGVTFLHDVQPQQDPFFLHYSIDQISSYVQTTNCATASAMNNLVPTVNAGSDYHIPKGTAFKLTAVGSDPDVGDQLTYSWEQANSNNTVFNNYLYPTPTASQKPNYRVYNPTVSSTQYFPPFEEVLEGSLYSTWNMTSDVNNTLHFVVQTRDNSSLGGQTASDQTQVNVVGTAGPFQVTSIEDGDAFPVGVQHNLTWDVNGTNTGNINTSAVKISLSTDGGETFSTLIATTPNDGQENITLPSQNVDKAFIMVEAINNIYYTLSPAFTVGNDAVIACDDYTEQGPFAIPGNGFPLEIFIDVQTAGVIEDMNVKLDVSGGAIDGLLVLVFGPNDTEPTFLYSATCGGNSMDVSFDQEGESIVLNCGNLNGQSVEPISGDLSKYYGSNQQGTWTVYVLNAFGSTSAVVNSASIEFCQRAIVPLSSQDVSLAADFTIYPNPSVNEVMIQHTSETNADAMINVFDVTGKNVLQKVHNFTQSNTTSMDISSLTTGVYFVKLNAGRQQSVKKLVVK